MVNSPESDVLGTRVQFGAKCPHLPFGLCPRLWDEAHAPEHSEDDLAMYGEVMNRRPHWPLWWLAAAVMAGLCAATSQSPGTRGTGSRLAFSATSGICIGAYIALEFFPGQLPLQVGLPSPAAIQPELF